MGEPRNIFPRTVEVIGRGMADKLHIGAQVYVSRDGKPVADFGIGEAQCGTHRWWHRPWDHRSPAGHLLMVV